MIRIGWITLVYNEMEILPYCVRYWQRMADRVIVFDNHSTDGSREYLSQFDWITIETFDSDGHNDIIQKQVKEQAYQKYKDEFEIIIITDADEIFYFSDFRASVALFLSQGCNCMSTELYALCEDAKPLYDDVLYLHQQCHKFHYQKMNHTPGFERESKFSIFNTKLVDKINMSVGQHYVVTEPQMKLMRVTPDVGFCLHIDKGFGHLYKFAIRQKMKDRLSPVNIKYKMGIEYFNDYETLRKEYEDAQKKSFDINENIDY